MNVSISRDQTIMIEIIGTGIDGERQKRTDREEKKKTNKIQKKSLIDLSS